MLNESSLFFLHFLDKLSAYNDKNNNICIKKLMVKFKYMKISFTILIFNI